MSEQNRSCAPPPEFGLADVVRRLEAIGREVADLLAHLNGHARSSPSDDPNMTDTRMLTVDEVAERLGLSKSEVYRRAKGWPFALKLSPKALRFSERGLGLWLRGSQKDNSVTGEGPP